MDCGKFCNDAVDDDIFIIEFALEITDSDGASEAANDDVDANCCIAADGRMNSCSKLLNVDGLVR